MTGEAGDTTGSVTGGTGDTTGSVAGGAGGTTGCGVGGTESTKAIKRSAVVVVQYWYQCGCTVLVPL
jgi:hypothetical protein